MQNLQPIPDCRGYSQVLELNHFVVRIIPKAMLHFPSSKEQNMHTPLLMFLALPMVRQLGV